MGVGAIRTITNSWAAGCRAFTMVTNKGRHTAVDLDTADWNKRHEYWRKVGGSPGWVIGGGLGLMGFVAVAASRVVYHSGLSFTLGLGSSINVVRGKLLYPGIGDDNRKIQHKCAGLLGTVASLPVLAPSMLTPPSLMTAAALLSVSLSPLVGGIKLLSNAVSFSGRVCSKPDSIIMNKFNTLEATLGISGRLVGDEINFSSSPPLFGGFGRFFRKSLTLNVQTPSERSLAALKKAYLSGRDQLEEDGFFDEQQLTEIKNTVLQQYPPEAQGCWPFKSTAEHQNILRKEVEAFFWFC